MKKPLLIDGAMGTELNIRGVSTPLPLWSADANLQNSKIVLDIHKDYIKSGSKVITTNTFRTTPWTYKKAGYSDKKSKEAARSSLYKAVDIAHKAREEDVLIAGSITSVDDCYIPLNFPGLSIAEENYGYLVDWLVDAGVDLILFETMGNIIEINCALNIAKNYELPKWLSIIFDDYCNLLDGTNIENLFAGIDKKSLECLLINCNTKKLTLEGLKKIRRIWSGSIGAYPNLGLTNYKNDYFKVIDKISFLRFLKALIDQKLDIIGLCCGSTPYHVSQLNSLIKDN